MKFVCTFYINHWFIRNALNVFLCINLCILKRLLVVPFSANLIFIRKLYEPCLQDAAYEIPLYLDYWFMRRTALNVFPYVSLSKMKSLLTWSFFGEICFYVQTLQTMSTGCCI